MLELHGIDVLGRTSWMEIRIQRACYSDPYENGGPLVT